MLANVRCALRSFRKNAVLVSIAVLSLSLGIGASVSRVAGMILREAGVLVAIGVAIAIPIYWGLARTVRSQLYGITPNDPSTLAAAIVLLAAVGMLAGFLPARRAAGVDPARILRYE